MKTFEQIKEESFNHVINHPEYFKTSYDKKMGGTQTVVLEGVGSFYFDDREYYSGRGAKYNNPSIHQNLGDVFVSRQQIEELAAGIAKTRWTVQQQDEEYRKRNAESYNKAVALVGKEKLEEGIAKITNTTYKAYYFIGNVMLYHGYKSEHISIDIITDEERAKFNWDEWASAPNAKTIGMTENDKNLFIC